MSEKGGRNQTLRKPAVDRRGPAALALGRRPDPASRFDGIPDVHYGDDDHFACGTRGASEWTISGTTVNGERIDVRGCDLWTFADDGKLVRKDSFWKIRDPS